MKQVYFPKDWFGSQQNNLTTWPNHHNMICQGKKVLESSWSVCWMKKNC